MSYSYRRYPKPVVRSPDARMNPRITLDGELGREHLWVRERDIVECKRCYMRPSWEGAREPCYGVALKAEQHGHERARAYREAVVHREDKLAHLRSIDAALERAYAAQAEKERVERERAERLAKRWKRR